MVDIINIALLIIGIIIVLRLLRWTRKRLRLIARLKTLTREYGGKVKFLRFPLLPTRVNSPKPDAYVRILDTVYLIRLYSGGSKHHMVHFASEKFSVRYMKMALRMLASPRRPGKGIAYADSGKAFTVKSKVFVSVPMEADDKLISEAMPTKADEKRVGDDKRIEKILLFNPAPHAVSYVNDERTGIKLALVGDELYGMKIYTGSSFCAYAAEKSKKDD